jgi:hypothetical protein
LRSLEMSGFQETHVGRLAIGLPADDLFSRKLVVFAHPDEVLKDEELSIEDKRALLASWVSDAFSIENSPTLRQLQNGAVVRVDDIVEALKSLDEPLREAAFTMSQSFARRAGKPIARRRNRSPHDDDRPPPPAAGARIPWACTELTGAHGNIRSASDFGHAREISIGGRSAA